MQLCCLLWAQPGQEAALTAYEEAVLGLLPEHGGTVVKRAIGDGADDRPHEVQFIEFTDEVAIDEYLGDPRRHKLADRRDQVVARTELFPVAFL